MKKFSDYAEKAIKRYGLAGYNNLAREIGVTKCVMSEFRNEKKTPSEETFLKIVELAGLPKEEALIDLNLWRSKDKPEVQKIWQRLSKMIGCALLISILNSQNIEKNQNLEISDNNRGFASYFICYVYKHIYTTKKIIENQFTKYLRVMYNKLSLCY